MYLYYWQGKWLLNLVSHRKTFGVHRCWRNIVYNIQLFRQRLSHKRDNLCFCTGQCRLALWVVRVWFWLIEVQGDSATRNEKERIHVFVLFLSTTLKHLQVHSSTVKTTTTHNNLRHCRVSFSPFVRQPFSKQLYICSDLKGLINIRIN